MILSLHIKNYALIEDLRLEFGPGLTVFTGETGAGKSIIIESLGLILGERASAQAVRHGTNRCFITGEFDCSRLQDLRAVLDAYGIELPKDENLIVRREIDASGKSRAFINDLPVSLATLEAAGAYLVDVHGQHEHQALLQNANQRGLLDRFGGLEESVDAIAAAYRSWKELAARKESQGLSEQEKERFIELYSFQVKEIDAAKLVPGEEEETERLLPQLKNAEKLLQLSDEAYHLLYGGDGSAIENLTRTQKLLESIIALGGNASVTAENLRSAYYQVEEAARDVETLRDTLKADPDALNALLERQDLIHKLKRKYGATLQDVLAYREKTAAELSALTQSDRNRQELEKEIAKARAILEKDCGKLSAARTRAAEKLSAGAEKELRDLGMKKARFSVQVNKEAEPGTCGWDAVQFLFSANAGEEPKPLKSIASGGEMSRVMLGLKTVLAKADRVPILVFDEIDAGVGGPMGRVIGKKLKGLARHHQVLCITHLPQIAVFGDSHKAVEKSTHSGRTATRVTELTDGTRVEEVARMLSGEDITPTARSHAQELLQHAQ